MPGISFSNEDVTLLTGWIRNAGAESAMFTMGYTAARFTLAIIWMLHGQQRIIECAYVESETDFSRLVAQSPAAEAEGR